jgi:hypothetical protein
MATPLGDRQHGLDSYFIAARSQMNFSVFSLGMKACMDRRRLWVTLNTRSLTATKGPCYSRLSQSQTVIAILGNGVLRHRVKRH